MYSQNKEEQIILDYFDKLSKGATPPRWIIDGTKPTFLDLGSNDGQTFSNTRALVERGWRGVCVEPSPTAFAKLKELYKDSKDVYSYNFAIGNTNAIKKDDDYIILEEILSKHYSNYINGIDTPELVQLLDKLGGAILMESGSLINKNDSALVSTMVKKEMDRFKSITKYNATLVTVYRYKTFLNRVKFKTFDFISIDIEGMEVDVMNQMDFKDVKLVCAEWNSKPEVKQEFDRILYGFKVIYTSGENLIYAK